MEIMFLYKKFIDFFFYIVMFKFFLNHFKSGNELNNEEIKNSKDVKKKMIIFFLIIIILLVILSPYDKFKKDDSGNKNLNNSKIILLLNFLNFLKIYFNFPSKNDLSLLICYDKLFQESYLFIFNLYSVSNNFFIKMLLLDYQKIISIFIYYFVILNVTGLLNQLKMKFISLFMK